MVTAKYECVEASRKNLMDLQEHNAQERKSKPVFGVMYHILTARI